MIPPFMALLLKDDRRKGAPFNRPAGKSRRLAMRSGGFLYRLGAYQSSLPGSCGTLTGR